MFLFTQEFGQWWHLIWAGLWAKVPRFSVGTWGMSSPRTSKTVRGTRAKRRVPRTVFEVRGLDIPQRSRGKMWNLIIIPWLCRFDTFIVVKDYFIKRGTLGVLFFNVPPFLRKTWDIGSTDFQCPTFFANNVPRFMKYPGKCPVLLLRVKPAKPGYNQG